MKDVFKKTNIICTIGPASEDKLEEMFKAGMNIARFNFSHASEESVKDTVEEFKKIREKLGISAGLLMDMQGPEIRLGLFSDEIKDGFVLNSGDKVSFTTEKIKCTKEMFSVSYDAFYKDVEPGHKLLIDDGAIELRVDKIENKIVKATVIDGGLVKEKKGLNAPKSILNIPGLKEKDIKDLEYAVRADFDFVAGSFIRNKEDVLNIKKELKKHGGENIKVIAKIENRQGMENIKEIIEVSDGIMVARGDLSVEVPLEIVPIYQKNIIKYCNNAAKPVIIATQMLDSMINNPLPTRAETSDVANAVYDRASAIMLSGETAIGKYPVKCVETMTKIARSVEKNVKYSNRINLDERKYNTIDEKDAYIAVNSIKTIGADAILAYTNSGNTIKHISSLGPDIPIFTVTSNLKTYNYLSIIWNVFPIYVPEKPNVDEMLNDSINALKKLAIIEEGDLIYITGGKEFVKSAKISKNVGGIAIF
mgnify:CR=1 FL=1